MQNISLFIEQAGKGKVPFGWFRKQTINIQRLYYIKSGDGYMVDESGARTPFLAHHMYLFPHNYNQEFVSHPDNPIDHIYIDFATTPPIIAKSPLIYPVGNGSSLMRMVDLLDSLLIERCPDPSHRIEPPAFFSEVTDAESGSYEEYKQLLHTLIAGLLTMLSYQKEIPFSQDPVVTGALEYMRTNYAASVNIEEVAGHFGYNVNHFIRRFRSVMGITPYAYLRHYRLSKARALIAGGMAVSEAAERVGYESASGLFRALKDAEP